MRNAWILLVVAAACGAMVGCGGASAGASGLSVPAASAGVGEPNAIGMQMYWEHRLALRNGEFVTRVYQLDEMFYCFSNQNRLFARDAATGLDRWAVTVAPKGTPVYRPMHVDKILLSETVPSASALVSGNYDLKPYDVVILNTNGQVIVINRRDGSILRTMDLPTEASSGGCTDGTYFYGGSANGYYYAFNIQRAVRPWIKHTDATMISAPAEYGSGRVFLTTSGGAAGSTFLSISPSLGEVVWQKPMGGTVTAPFVVDKRAIFVGCEDARVYALPLEARTNFWDRPFVCLGPIRTAVQVSENTVFAKAEGDKFYAINLVNGQQRWTLPGATVVGALIGSDAYVQSNGQLLEVDEMLGKNKGSMSLGDLSLVCPSTNAKAIWAASPQGHIVCLRPASVPALKAQDIRDAVK